MEPGQLPAEETHAAVATPRASVVMPPPARVNRRSPAMAALLAVLPAAGLVALRPAISLFATIASGWGDVLLWIGPMLSGLLAAAILLRGQPTRRADSWKCAIWIWTWSLLLAFVTTDAAVIFLFPFLFAYHLLFIALAAIGLGIGEVAIALRRGWISLTWIKPGWYLVLVGSLGGLLLLVIVLAQAAK